MPTRFRPYHPDQGLLLPSDMRDWLPEGHLAHHVGDLVDGLDLTAFYAPYEGDGRRKSPYEPRMMLKVLIYGYATGVVSSRGLARRLQEDVAFRVLAAGNFPSHRTLCEFRRRHLGDFKRLFVEVVRLAGRLAGATSCRRSCAGARTGWRRSGRRRHGLRPGSGRRTRPVGGSPDKSAIRRAVGRTSASTGSRTGRRRTISRTRKAGS